MEVEVEVEVEVAEWRLEFELLSRKLWLPRRRHFRSIPLSLGEFPQKVFSRHCKWSAAGQTTCRLKEYRRHRL